MPRSRVPKHLTWPVTLDASRTSFLPLHIPSIHLESALSNTVVPSDMYKLKAGSKSSKLFKSRDSSSQITYPVPVERVEPLSSRFSIDFDVPTTKKGKGAAWFSTFTPPAPPSPPGRPSSSFETSSGNPNTLRAPSRRQQHHQGAGGNDLEDLLDSHLASQSDHYRPRSVVGPVPSRSSPAGFSYQPSPPPSPSPSLTSRDARHGFLPPPQVASSIAQRMCETPETPPSSPHRQRAPSSPRKVHTPPSSPRSFDSGRFASSTPSSPSPSSRSSRPRAAPLPLTPPASPTLGSPRPSVRAQPPFKALVLRESRHDAPAVVTLVVGGVRFVTAVETVMSTRGGRLGDFVAETLINARQRRQRSKPLPNPQRSISSTYGALGFPTDISQSSSVTRRSLMSTDVETPESDSITFHFPSPPLSQHSVANPILFFTDEDLQQPTSPTRSEVPTLCWSASSEEDEVAPKMTPSLSQEEFEIFLDRDGDVYSAVVAFLRTGSLPPSLTGASDGIDKSLYSARPSLIRERLTMLRRLEEEAMYLEMSELRDSVKEETAAVAELVRELRAEWRRDARTHYGDTGSQWI